MKQTRISCLLLLIGLAAGCSDSAPVVGGYQNPADATAGTDSWTGTGSSSSGSSSGGGDDASADGTLSDDGSSTDSATEAGDDSAEVAAPDDASNDASDATSSEAATDAAGDDGGIESGATDGSTEAATDASIGDGGVPSCAYTNDKQFCACLGNYSCGATAIKDSAGTWRTVYCGGCTQAQYCQPGTADIGLGSCADNPYVKYPWQREKIDMLVSMGENDNTIVDYSSCANIKDGRGYTIGQVGFCTGTGDFVLVAACYNDRKPGNILSKYWPALQYYGQQFYTTGLNQADTSKIDTLSGKPAAQLQFCKDIAAAAAEKDGIFDSCQNDVGDGINMSQAITHAKAKGLQGLLTLGFLYDTELNFGEGDEVLPDGGVGLGGTATVIARADADYAKAMPLPSDFTGKTWEESRWLGFLIQERTVEMSTDATWSQALDENATWEAGRRKNTAKTNMPETATDLSMAYDFTSNYYAAFGANPCWKSPPISPLFKANWNSAYTVYRVGLDKTASATNQMLWKAIGPKISQARLACPANPTP